MYYSKHQVVPPSLPSPLPFLSLSSHRLPLCEWGKASSHWSHAARMRTFPSCFLGSSLATNGNAATEVKLVEVWSCMENTRVDATEKNSKHSSWLSSFLFKARLDAACAWCGEFKKLNLAKEEDFVLTVLSQQKTTSQIAAKDGERMHSPVSFFTLLQKKCWRSVVLETKKMLLMLKLKRKWWEKRNAVITSILQALT